ncbi:MAG: hypothetical protein WA384_03315 [Rhodomicrobium sp.]
MRMILTGVAAAAFLIASAFGAFAAGSTGDTMATTPPAKTVMHKHKAMHHTMMRHRTARTMPRRTAMHHRTTMHPKTAMHHRPMVRRKASLQHKTKKPAGSPGSTY